MKQELEKLNKRISQLIAMNNQAAGNDAATRLVISALAAQAPDPQRLLRDFAQRLEDTSVRTMFSSMPESFYQSVQLAGESWKQVLMDGVQAQDQAK